MQIWAGWVLADRERGWPATDSLERARQHAQTATEKTGIARRKPGTPEQPEPKSTRQKRGTVVPHDLDRDTWGLKVHHWLEDYRAEGQSEVVDTLVVDTLLGGEPVSRRASIAGISVSAFKSRRARGFAYLRGCLTATPFESRRGHTAHY